LTLRPSRSSASNIGAENRKVRRWEKFIDSPTRPQADALRTPSGPGGPVAGDVRRPQLKTAYARRNQVSPAARRAGPEPTQHLGTGAAFRRAQAHFTELSLPANRPLRRTNRQAGSWISRTSAARPAGGPTSKQHRAQHLRSRRSCGRRPTRERLIRPS
jgi:hypothetical protein